MLVVAGGLCFNLFLAYNNFQSVHSVTAWLQLIVGVGLAIYATSIWLTPADVREDSAP